jgi:glycosyltransferase involved in cell wall biosynthesis
MAVSEDRRTYGGTDLAILVPTKDRPHKLRCLLESLAQQTEPCGRIIVIDGGESVRDTVMSFAGRLPVEYQACHPPGQIRQRNMGIALLDDSTPLVGSLDDDIVLLPTAVEHLIRFWNTRDHDTAGVSFNIVNLPAERHSWLTGLFGLTGPEQGRVLRSGRNTPILSVPSDLRTQWLCGGATVWKLHILRTFSNRERYAQWAMAEDLLFSYPIGKLYPLYVCADAKVRHEHVFDHKIPMKHKYYGRTETLWRFAFVESHKELSRAAFLWMQSATIVARLCKGVLCFQPRHIQFAIGQADGVACGLAALMRGDDVASLLSETPAGGSTRSPS